MDGLLLDSERAIRDAWLSVAQSNGVALSEAAYLQVIGRNAADSRGILEKTFCGAYDEARRTAQALLDETMLEQGYAVKPGVFELLTDLRARTCVREPACERRGLLRGLFHARALHCRARVARAGGAALRPVVRGVLNLTVRDARSAGRVLRGKLFTLG